MPPRVLPLLAVVVLVTAAACTSGPPPPDESSYTQEIQDWRASRERALLEDPDTIPAERRAQLLPLLYYAADPKYKVPAELRLADRRRIVEMPTSTGTIRRMELIGNLAFTFEGQQMTLGALVPEGTRQVEGLFVPFADLTTGKETYPAGRYLDIPPTSSGFYTIDFNRAYNPTCAYNDSYECPYPPPSNRLKVEIRAGEKAPGAEKPPV